MALTIDKVKIKQLRLQKSMTQEALAESSSINLRTVQRIEKDGVASLQSCKNLAAALNVDPIDLLLDEDQAANTRPSNLIIPALTINCVVFLAWGVAQIIFDVRGTDSIQGGIFSLLMLFFAAIVLITFLTPFTVKRIFLILGCILVATIMAPPKLLYGILLAIPLWLLSEWAMYLSQRFRSDTVKLN